MNVTYKQKDMLLNILQEKPELIRGRVDRKSESRKNLNNLWDEVAVQINSIDEGPQKSGKEWAKTWKDIKGYILKKESKRRSYSQGTGGGPPPKIAFSNFEENVLKLLTPEAAGLENIPEGGITNEMNCNIEQVNAENKEMRSEDVQNLEINLAGEIEEEGNIENVPLPNRKSTSINNTRRVVGSSMQQLSRNMLDIQTEKLQLKREEIRLKKKTLKVQRKILFELKDIKSQLSNRYSDNI